MFATFLNRSVVFDQAYGNYFLAETIEAQDEHNHAIVAEVGGKAIAFMSICDHVNIDLLQVTVRYLVAFIVLLIVAGL